MFRSTFVVLTAALVCGSTACGSSDGDPPLYPENYRDTYTEVRNCRNSIEHDLMRIRVLASPETLAAYQNRTPFPVGALLVKEQFDSPDTDCSGPIINVTVMQKLAAGEDPDALDWKWQKTDIDNKVIDLDVQSCTGCHTTCGRPPEGYDGTCTVP